MSIKTNILGEMLNGAISKRIEIIDLPQIFNDETPCDEAARIILEYGRI